MKREKGLQKNKLQGQFLSFVLYLFERSSVLKQRRRKSEWQTNLTLTSGHRWSRCNLEAPTYELFSVSNKNLCCELFCDLRKISHFLQLSYALSIYLQIEVYICQMQSSMFDSLLQSWLNKVQENWLKILFPSEHELSSPKTANTLFSIPLKLRQMSSFLKETMPAAKIIKVYMKAINQRRIRQKYITTILIFRPTDLLRVSFMLVFPLIYQQAFCLFFQLSVFCAR